MTKTATYRRSPDAAHRWWHVRRPLRMSVEVAVDRGRKKSRAAP